MTKITILGAGVTGMTIASQLPKDCEITIVGKHLPGDEADMNSKDWASPWAAAIWLSTHSHLCNAREQKMMLEALVGLRELAERHPESSARKLTIREVMGTGTPAQVWYQHKVPNFRFLDKTEIPKEAKYGMTFETVVITPQVFLPWLRERLEAKGVDFKRVSVGSLAELKGLGHDILINASGLGSATLLDVEDSGLKPLRLQSCFIKHPTYRQGFVRRGDGYYSTAFAHLDGEVYVGGIIESGSDDTEAYSGGRQTLFDRLHENNPDIFPSNDPLKCGFLRDHTGWYPARALADGGVRVEAERVGDQQVIHAYGQHAGGYTYSFGLAWEVSRMVQEIVSNTKALSAKI